MALLPDVVVLFSFHKGQSVQRGRRLDQPGGQSGPPRLGRLHNGLVKNPYAAALVQHEVLMDDLFA